MQTVEMMATNANSTEIMIMRYAAMESLRIRARR